MAFSPGVFWSTLTVAIRVGRLGLEPRDLAEL